MPNGTVAGARHTPGPLTVVPLEFGIQLVTHEEGTGAPRVVAALAGDPVRDARMMRDAALFANAAGLLEAAQDTLLQLGDLQRHCDLGHEAVGTEIVRRLLLVAVRKAGGKGYV